MAENDKPPRPTGRIRNHENNCQHRNAIMLILRTFVNAEQIDEIHIQNAGQHSDDFWRYKIRLPEGHDGPTFLHRRSTGWRPLAEKVLHYLNKIEPIIDIEGEKRTRRAQQTEQS